MREVICQYCGKQAEYVDSAEVYATSYGMIYICKPCNAYVGVHKDTDKPKGTLANKELRELRKTCHALFDPLWKSGKVKRKDAYLRMSQFIDIPENEAHIGMFDNEKCLKLITKMNQFYEAIKNRKKESQ